VRYEQEQAMPASAAGSAEIHDERISQDLKVDYDQQYSEHDREHQSAQKPT